MSSLRSQSSGSHNSRTVVNLSPIMGLDDLHEATEAFRPVFAVACPILCAMGIVANCFNVLVLTRKAMLSPTNVILVWLAVADGLSMTSMLIFNVALHYIDASSFGSLTTMRVLHVTSIAACWTHSTAIWFDSVLATFRSLVVYYPFHAIRMCTIPNVNIVLVVVSVLTTFLTLPNAFSYVIRTENFTHHHNTTEILYYIGIKSTKLWNANLILQSVACKLLPCLLLLVLNVLLIRGMTQAGRQHQQLNTGRKLSSASSTINQIRRPSAGSSDKNRNPSDNQSISSTGLLVAVVTLTIVTETPQRVLMLWRRFDSVAEEIHISLADVLDVLTIINSGINLLLYCTMSSKFRATFADGLKKMFRTVYCSSKQ